MENRWDDEEVELMVIGAAAVEQLVSPPAKRRRLARVTEKGGSSSSSFDPIKPFVKFAADMAATQIAVAEALEPLKRKACKTKVPFY